MDKVELRDFPKLVKITSKFLFIACPLDGKPTFKIITIKEK